MMVPVKKIKKDKIEGVFRFQTVLTPRKGDKKKQIAPKV